MLLLVQSVLGRSRVDRAKCARSFVPVLKSSLASSFLIIKPYSERRWNTTKGSNQNQTLDSTLEKMPTTPKRAEAIEGTPVETRARRGRSVVTQEQVVEKTLEVEAPKRSTRTKAKPTVSVDTVIVETRRTRSSTKSRHAESEDVQPSMKSTQEAVVMTSKRLKDTTATEADDEAPAESEKGPGRLMLHERRYWKLGCKFVVGVDEAGRGPLAGPVVVAACAIDENAPDVDSTLIDDSKKLTEEEREQVYDILIKSKHVHYEIAIVDHEKIDDMNILKATLFGMDQVVKGLTTKSKCDAVLVDGPFKPPVAAVEQKHIEAIKGGDSKVRAIGAASVLAKVTRDRLMQDYHVKFPMYGFDKHKGYPVKDHVRALFEHGPCEIHRRSYGPVKRALEAAAAAKKDLKSNDK